MQLWYHHSCWTGRRRARTLETGSAPGQIVRPGRGKRHTITGATMSADAHSVERKVVTRSGSPPTARVSAASDRTSASSSGLGSSLA